LHLENEVVKKVLSGDIDSFEYLVDSYKGLVFSIALNMTKDPFEAENLTQEIFLKVYRSLPSYEFRGFKSWISRIAVNSCIDYKRSQKSRVKETIIPPEELTNFSLDTGPPPEEFVIAKEEEDAALKVCESLPEIYRLVIKKYYIDSKGVRKIAEEEGISCKTVETRLYRGLSLLRKKWKEGCG